jgi:hypothetical protein
MLEENTVKQTGSSGTFLHKVSGITGFSRGKHPDPSDFSVKGMSVE